MSSDEDTSSTVTAEMARIKRKLKATQDELETLKGNKKSKGVYVPFNFCRPVIEKNATSTNSTLGRQLCRTVDLVLRLDAYVNERDHRVTKHIAPFGVHVEEAEPDDTDPRR